MARAFSPRSTATTAWDASWTAAGGVRVLGFNVVAASFRPAVQTEAVLRRGDFIAPVIQEVRRVIVGQDHLIDRLLIGLLCDGHLLIEGVPGLAKTLAVKTLADTIDADFKRLQMTPDLLPADLIGTMVYDPREQTFSARKGPLFTDILLTDEINRAAGIDSPYRHVLSRGVSLSVPRNPLHTSHLAIETGGGTAMAYVPWGPVGMWGSTDTVHPDMDSAREIEPADIRSLLGQLNQHLASPVGPADIVSLRCGVRPVAVPRDTPVDEHSSSALSRHHRVHADRSRRWISVYGGKLSGCTTLAREVQTRIAASIGTRAAKARGNGPGADLAGAPTVRFPGLDEPVVSPSWSAANEGCRTLDDYLRRRTNIAQWIPRGGLGRHYEYLDHLHEIAAAIHGGDTANAAGDVDRYRQRADREWRLIEGAFL